MNLTCLLDISTNVAFLSMQLDFGDGDVRELTVSTSSYFIQKSYSVTGLYNVKLTNLENSLIQSLIINGDFKTN